MAGIQTTEAINTQVMGDMIEAKINALCRVTPYAKVDTSLQGVPGDTKIVPSWNYVGDAEDFVPGDDSEMESTKLTATSTSFPIKCAAKSISIFETVINSGLGDPIGQAELQLARSIASKVDNDLLDAAMTATTTCGDGSTAICYDGIVDAVSKFEDEDEGCDKVMFINPKQEATLLKDPDFLSADKFVDGVAVNGAIGRIAGCWIKKSRKIAAKDGAYTCPVIKLRNEETEAELGDDELPALTIFLKKDTQVDHEWMPKKQRHDVTATKYYGVALTNGAKIVLAKFKA